MPGCLTISALVVAVVSALVLLYGDGKVRMHYPPPHWRIEDMPSDMSGKVALVTGANAGLGFETALELMKRGCEVIIATRSSEKGKEALKRMQTDPNLPKAMHSKGVVPPVGLQLGSLASVKAFSESVLKSHKKLDILVLNAGIMLVPFELTEDTGTEMHMAVNHLGHYALTLRLMPLLLKAGKGARVVTVSSAGHHSPRHGGIDFEGMNDESKYDRMSGYGQSKLANVLFASALAKRVQAKGVLSNSCHPGAVHTELARNVVDWAAPLLGKDRAARWADFVARTLFMTAKEGATTQLYLATAAEVEEKNISGQYFVPTARLANSNPLSFDMGKSKLAGDNALAEKLWKWSAEVTGLDLE